MQLYRQEFPYASKPQLTVTKYCWSFPCHEIWCVGKIYSN